MPPWWVAIGFISAMETHSTDTEEDAFLPCHLLWGSVDSGRSSAWYLLKQFKRAVRQNTYLINIYCEPPMCLCLVLGV